ADSRLCPHERARARPLEPLGGAAVRLHLRHPLLSPTLLPSPPRRHHCRLPPRPPVRRRERCPVPLGARPCCAPRRQPPRGPPTGPVAPRRNPAGAAPWGPASRSVSPATAPSSCCVRPASEPLPPGRSRPVPWRGGRGAWPPVRCGPSHGRGT